MRTSSTKILTTHVGSLPNVVPLDPYNPDEASMKAAVAAVVKRQRDLGLDLINEGEYTKGGDWLTYMDGRFGGYEERPLSGPPIITQGKDREEFADFYKYASEKGTLFFMPGELIRTKRPNWTCTGPVTYRAQDLVKREIEILNANVPLEDAFLTTTAPASLEPYRKNEFYKTDEEYLFAIAEAMKVEYDLIAKSGLVLQVDDAWLPALWDRIGMKMGLDAFLKRCEVRVEALNHALRDVPESQIRYHFCWGSWHGPHAFDLEMKHLVNLMLKVKAQAYSFEAANVRHEHEYVVWSDTKLPSGKLLMPGVITHSTDVIEHPELVAQRIVHFAERVGKENVIASADCGFGGRSHPQIAWAKLKSLVDGAAIATKALSGR